MKIINGTTLGLATLAATLSTGVNANCPSNLPTQLLEDCIVVEGSGASFPNPTYAYKKEYEAWLAAQAQQTQPAAGQSGKQQLTKAAAPTISQ